MIGEEKHQKNIAGLIFDQHFIGRLGAGRRRPVLDDDGLQRHDAVHRRFGDLRPVTPVDGAEWQVKEQIDDARRTRGARHDLVEKLGGFRPDSEKIFRGGEKRIEEGGPHCGILVSGQSFAKPPLGTC